MPETPWELSDEKLLQECRLEAYIGHGPGGQKRNKSSVAIRITHTPTNITATAAESRSQRENKIHAIRRLRHKLAMEMRREIDPVNFTAPSWLNEYAGLHMSSKNPRYPQLIALVLDLLKAMQWSIGRTAVLLGVTTSVLTRVIHDDPALWTHINHTRTQLGMKPLRWE